MKGLSAWNPSWPVVSEEGEHDPPDNGLWWCVDPVDGTQAMLQGLAHWGPTVALMDGDVALLGGLHEPLTGRMWLAKRGEGLHTRGVFPPPLPPAEGGEGTLLVPSGTHRVVFPWKGRTYGVGSTAIHLALTASGHVSGTVIPRWAPWDVVLGLLMAQEAGLDIFQLSGDDADPMQHPSQPFVVCHPHTRHALENVLRRTLSSMAPPNDGSHV